MSHILGDLPDHLLLKQCKEGSEVAFNTLFRRYFTKLYAHMNGTVGYPSLRKRKPVLWNSGGFAF